MKNEIKELIADKIIKNIEKAGGWTKTWAKLGASSINANSKDAVLSYATGKPYAFSNQFMLDFECGEYATFNQIQKAGGFVKKGEHGRTVFFWKMMKVVEKDATTGKETLKTIPILRNYTVFKVGDQTEGISLKYADRQPKTQPTEEKRNQQIDIMINDYCQRSGLRIAEDGTDPCYSSMMHKVFMPTLGAFTTPDNYYLTKFHEVGHSTGHRTLLNRPLGNPFGSEKYSREELIAEITACCLGGRFGLLNTDTEKNSQAYLASWLKVLKENKTELYSALSSAEKAYNLVVGSNDDDESVE